MEFPRFYKGASIGTEEIMDTTVVSMSRITRLNDERAMNTVVELKVSTPFVDLVAREPDPWLERMYETLEEREKVVKECW